MDGFQLFDLLLTEINAKKREEQHESLQKATMDHVVVHKKSRCWDFHLHVDQLLPASVYFELWTHLTLRFKELKALNEVKLFIHAAHNAQDEIAVQSYFPIVQQITSLSERHEFQHGCSQMVPYINNDKVYLPVSESTLIPQIELNCLSQLEKGFEQVGFAPFHIHLINDASAEKRRNEAVKEEMEQKTAEVVNSYKEQKEHQRTQESTQWGRKIKHQPMELCDVTQEGYVTVSGRLFFTEIKELGRTTLYTAYMTDYTNSLTLKVFCKNEQDIAKLSSFTKGMWVNVTGNVREDRYFNDELVLFAEGIEVITHDERHDNADNKRIELHAHTMMSQLDAPLSVSDLVKQAADFGHQAVAITDHEVVQSFPDAYQAGKKYGVKILYGLEAYVVDNGKPIAYNEQHQKLTDATYVVFDVETTGFSSVYNRIIELSAVKMHKGNIIEEFEHFIKIDEKLNPKIIELTHITDELLAQQGEDEKEVIQVFMEFAAGSILVAHNSPFDMSFLNATLRRHQLQEATLPVIDTLEMARMVLPEMKRHGLKNLSKHFNINLDNHHRAIYDAEATAHVYWRLFKLVEEKGMHYHDDLNKEMERQDSFKQLHPFHLNIIVKNQTGLKNLFKLVSLSHVKYFYQVARIPRKELVSLRDGLLFGSSCDEGELFKSMLDKGYEATKEKARFYDFIEVMPTDFYRPLIATDKVKSEKEIEDVVQQLVAMGEELDIPVVATGNVHYLERHDKIYREVLMATKMKGRTIHLPDTPYLTTEEMLEVFSYLGEEKAYEIVVKNTQMIADWCEEVVPVKDELYTPKMDGADDEIKALSYGRAHELYGDVLPDIVEKRLEKELNSIISNGFSVIYLIAQKLVHKSLSDGYLVGSRGSVGSSFVATMTGITEVNPLCPHYHCPKCQYSEFYDHGEYASGYDMPDKVCPECGTPLKKDGQDIPFETFLGFHGDKVPDIDLNFSGSYQPEAHAYTKVLFGEDNVYRAGTIGTVAEKTAVGFAKGYAEDYHLQLNQAETQRLAHGIAGVKRTTGSHPGGIIVIPDYMDVYDFTPIQYPANKIDTDWRTTHFDFHSIHDNVLKLDILGHDDPTVIRMLQDLSGIDPKTIPTDDPDVIALFSGTDSLGVTSEEIYSSTGTLGVPEFGTNFVRNMLDETKPTTFAELVQISGLSHGTDVWNNNAQTLIKDGIATLPECIGCRDDIMVYLMHHGLEDGTAFTIMESVRKGKGLTEEWQQLMRDNNVPQWYIDSCLKIKYMFPKAHAAAYVLMAIRVAYFKVHFPLVYYCAYFSIRAKRFEIDVMCRGKEAVKERLEELYKKRSEMKLSVTEEESVTSLELANEMLARGYDFKMVDLYRSQATDFVIDGHSLLFPFIAVPDLGENVAKKIVEEREIESFTSKENLRRRTHLSETLTQFLDQYGVLEGLDDEDQLSLF